jgi:hypothetical protein
MNIKNMAQLSGKIKSIDYKKALTENLPICGGDDVNAWAAKCCINYENCTYAVSKWVSPKRTRSYPYSRVYDTLSTCGGKVITIIPIIKDEGLDGDMDYLQWDTISLMSLLNVYVIIAYYNEADKNDRKGRKPNKITNQRFDSSYVVNKLNELNSYHSSALHWNLKQLERENLEFLLNLSIDGYKNISNKLSIKIHDISNIQKFKNKISEARNSFMNLSRNKAKQAQNRESLTIQPKEALSNGEKMTIEIENYLGGNYYLTVDDVIIKDKYYLIESKHTNSGLLPALDDIKDGLLKMFIFSNIDELKTKEGSVNFKPVLRLTSEKLQGKIEENSSEKSLNSFFICNNFNESQKKLIKTLIKEANMNNFGILVEKSSIGKNL